MDVNPWPQGSRESQGIEPPPEPRTSLRRRARWRPSGVFDRLGVSSIFAPLVIPTPFVPDIRLCYRADNWLVARLADDFCSRIGKAPFSDVDRETEA